MRLGWQQSPAAARAGSAAGLPLVANMWMKGTDE
jgi:hypothetical protein